MSEAPYPQPAAGLPVAPVPTIASMGRRLWAYVADLVLALIAAIAVATAAGAIVGFYAGVSGKPDNWIDSSAFDHDALRIGLVLGVAAAWFFYFGLPWLSGGTPGKLVAGLRIRRTDGGKVRFWQAHVRELVRVLEALFLGLPYLAAFADQHRRTLHDRAAGTVVLKVRNAAPTAPVYPPVAAPAEPPTDPGSSGLSYKVLDQPPS
jgi:uncharacterized RDD family membrane protein YckC